MELHGVVTAAPGMAQSAHDASLDDSSPAFDVVRHSAVGLNFFAAFAAAPGAVCVDETVQAQEFRCQLLGIGLRYDRIQIAVHDHGRHAGVIGDVDCSVDQADRVAAAAAPHGVHCTDCGVCVAEDHA